MLTPRMTIRDDRDVAIQLLAEGTGEELARQDFATGVRCQRSQAGSPRPTSDRPDQWAMEKATDGSLKLDPPLTEAERPRFMGYVVDAYWNELARLTDKDKA